MIQHDGPSVVSHARDRNESCMVMRESSTAALPRCSRNRDQLLKYDARPKKKEEDIAHVSTAFSPASASEAPTVVSATALAVSSGMVAEYLPAMRRAWA